jgi:hypothetical protein
MKQALRILAALVLVASAAYWLAAGANRGWTKNHVPVKILDEVTGIEGITYIKNLVPGLDFLGAAILGAGILAGASFCFRNRTSKPETKTMPT